VRPDFWPFSRRAAVLTSLVLVPACVAVALILDAQDVAGFDSSGWTLVAAVLVGLLPVILLVLGGVGSVEAAGVRIAFAAVQGVVASASAVEARTLLAHNLGQAPGQVMDSGSDTVIETLSNAVGNDVVVVDLKEGGAWWETRLLLLAAGAARLQNPRAVAFTVATPDRPRKFIGWARPVDIRRRLIEAHPEFAHAQGLAERDALMLRLSARDLPAEPPQLPWAPAPTAPHPVWFARDDRFVPERLLLQRLAGLEVGARSWALSEYRLRDLLASVLYSDAVDRDDTEERWVGTIVGSTAEYFAVTSGGQLVTLIPRPAALNAVFLSVLHGRAGDGAVPPLPAA
jgi:hypothetical protein